MAPPAFQGLGFYWKAGGQMAQAEGRAQTAEHATCALMEQHRKELDDLRQAHAADLASLADHHQKVRCARARASASLADPLQKVQTCAHVFVCVCVCVCGCVCAGVYLRCRSPSKGSDTCVCVGGGGWGGE